MQRALVVAVLAAISFTSVPALTQLSAVPEAVPSGVPLVVEAAFSFAGGLFWNRITAPVRLTLHNRSSEQVTVIWDESSLTDPSGVSQRVTVKSVTVIPGDGMVENPRGQSVENPRGQPQESFMERLLKAPLPEALDMIDQLVSEFYSFITGRIIIIPPQARANVEIWPSDRESAGSLWAAVTGSSSPIPIKVGQSVRLNLTWKTQQGSQQSAIWSWRMTEDKSWWQRNSRRVLTLHLYIVLAVIGAVVSVVGQ